MKFEFFRKISGSCLINIELFLENLKWKNIIQWKNPFQINKKKLFLIKKIQETVILCWIEPNNFNFSILTLSLMDFEIMYVIMTSKLTLGSFFKVDQDQIIFPVVPKFYVLMKNIFYFNFMITWNKASGHLRYFRICRIKIR